MATKSSVPAVDPQSAIGAAKIVLARISDATQRARFVALPAAELDLRQLERYAGLVAAADAAATAYVGVTAEEGEALVPVSTAQRAIETRARMFKCVEYNVADSNDAVRRQLDEIRAGHGYRDLASDLAALAVLYADHDALVRVDTKGHRATDAADALALAAELQSARVSVAGGPAKRAGERWAKAFADLRPVHEDLIATGRWLDRKSADPTASYPSLFAAVGRPAKGKSKPKKPVVEPS